MKQGLVRLLYNFGKRFMGWTLHMIMCVLLCYPVSVRTYYQQGILFLVLRRFKTTPATCILKTKFLLSGKANLMFLCQLTCQSAGIMSSLCGVGVRVRVRVNNFSSKTTRPRDVLFFLKDTLSIEDEKLFKACKSVCSSVC